MVERPLGVYVHWPFCKAKCPYCDFNSHVRHVAIDATAFAAGLMKQLKWFANETPGRTVTSVFFGGGTPSLMPPAQVAAVIDEISCLWPVAEDVEITLEANPTSVEAANFEGYRTAGVNRVSVGIQALDGADLKFLGRQHSVEEGLEAFRLATRLFSRTSFDLIYARPGQTPQSWQRELARALTEQNGHMSLYQLTIEPNTAFYRLWQAGQLATASDDTAIAMFEITQELTRDAGLLAYEVSNHALKQHECRHNKLYWNYGEYAGIGPGAHSRLITAGGQRRAVTVESLPETWLINAGNGGAGFVEDELLSGSDAARECLLMGLRTAEGVSLSRLSELSGKPLNTGELCHLIDDGLITAPGNGDTILATSRGRQLLNSVIEHIALRVLP